MVEKDVVIRDGGRGDREENGESFYRSALTPRPSYSSGIKTPHQGLHSFTQVKTIIFIVKP